MIGLAERNKRMRTLTAALVALVCLIGPASMATAQDGPETIAFVNVHVIPILPATASPW